jgi:hypothetical protein
MRRIRLVWIATAAVAVAYLGWVFAGRAVNTSRWARRNAPPEDAATEFARVYGGTSLEILQFYAREGNILEGTKTVICYGVLNAKSVKIEPAVDGVSPSLNRCVEVSAEKETRFTLTAEGHDGRTASESFVLGVRPDEATLPRIRAFAVTKTERDYSGKWIFSLAFSAENPEEVSIDPPVFPTLHRSPMGSFYVAPQQTTTYTLTVTGKFGHKATRSVTVQVPPPGAERGPGAGGRGPGRAAAFEGAPASPAFSASSNMRRS